MTRADADLTRVIYGRVPVLINEATGANPWGVRFMLMFMMNTASHLFHDTSGPGRVPLYEAKLFHQFTHRWATFTQGETTRDITSAELADPSVAIRPRYWLDKTHVDAKLDGRWDRQWLLTYRMMARSTDERTWMVSAMPRVAVGHSASVCLLSGAPTADMCLFLANVNNVVTDFVMRLKAGGANLSYFVVNQLPVLSTHRYDGADRAFIVPRVVELTYTAWDMQSFARDMGMDGAPFRWDEGRRAVIRAELDAWYAMKYGLTRKQLRYVLDPHGLTGREIETLVTDASEDAPDAPRVKDFPGETFRVLKDRETRQYGEFRTARLVMEAWDALSKAGWDPSLYASPLTLPPGDARARHGEHTR